MIYPDFTDHKSGFVKELADYPFTDMDIHGSDQ
jgi:hypothetical protein